MYQFTYLGVLRLSDNKELLEDVDDPDWVEYLDWVARGGQTLPRWQETFPEGWDYQLTPGGIKRLSDNAILPNDPNNKDFQQFLRWTEQGNRPRPMPTPPPQSYRDLRARAYAGFNTVLGLGQEADTTRTIGDVLDTIIEELSTRGAAATAAFGTMLDRRAAIKTKYPKP